MELPGQENFRNISVKNILGELIEAQNIAVSLKRTRADFGFKNSHSIRQFGDYLFAMPIENNGRQIGVGRQVQGPNCIIRRLKYQGHWYIG